MVTVPVMSDTEEVEGGGHYARMMLALPWPEKSQTYYHITRMHFSAVSSHARYVFQPQAKISVWVDTYLR